MGSNLLQTGGSGRVSFVSVFRVVELANNILEHVTDREVIALARINRVVREVLRCAVCQRSPCCRICYTRNIRWTRDFKVNTHLPEQIALYWSALHPTVSTCRRPLVTGESRHIVVLTDIECALYKIRRTSLSSIITDEENEMYDQSRHDWIEARAHESAPSRGDSELGPSRTTNLVLS